MALISYDDGVETLALAVNYRGDVEDFAWVIPVPSRPAIVNESRELFSELAELTVNRARGKDGLLQANAGVDSAEVTVYEERTVGMYDIAVLGAEDSLGLLEWLNANGYKVSDKARTVLQRYIDRDWYFIASKINAGAEVEGYEPGYVPYYLGDYGDVQGLQALRITFKTKDIVYPLTISSINGGKAEVLLYFLYDKEISVPGFETKVVRKLGYDDVAYYEYMQDYVYKEKVLTKLNADFWSYDMRDIVIEIDGDEDRWLTGSIAGKAVEDDNLLLYLVFVLAFALLITALSYANKRRTSP